MTCHSIRALAAVVVPEIHDIIEMWRWYIDISGSSEMGGV